MTQGDVLRTLLPRYLNKMRFTNPSNGYHTAIMMRLDSFPLSATTNFQNFYSIPIEGSLSFNLYALILMLSSLIQTALSIQKFLDRLPLGGYARRGHFQAI
jgi:hypothetical protein